MYFFIICRSGVGLASYRTSPPIGSNGWTLNGQDTSKIIKITESSAENCKESDDDESPGTHPPSGDTVTERILFPGKDKGNENSLK